MGAFNIRKFDRALDKKDDLLDLAKAVFKATWGIIEKKWEWQYFANPNCVDPPIYLALKEGYIAGSMGYIPIRLIINGREVDAAWMIDAMTHPDFRRMGISMRLHERIEKDFTVILAKSISNMISPLDHKRNYVFIRPARYMVRVIDYKNFLKALLKDKKSTINNATVKSPEQMVSPIGFERVRQFDHRFDELADNIKYQFEYMIKKTALYLKWRYLECPLAKYIIFQSCAGDTLKGFVVLRIVREGGIKMGWIVDLSVSPSDSDIFNKLIQGSLAYFKMQQVVCVYTLASHRSIKRNLYKKLFLPKMACARIIAKSGVESLALQADARFWHMTEGDSDIELFRGTYS